MIKETSVVTASLAVAVLAVAIAMRQPASRARPQRPASFVTAELQSDGRTISFCVDSTCLPPKVSIHNLMGGPLNELGQQYWFPAIRSTRIANLIELTSFYSRRGEDVPPAVDEAFKSGHTVYVFTALKGAIGKALPMTWLIAVNDRTAVGVADSFSTPDSRLHSLDITHRRPSSFQALPLRWQ